MRKVKDLKVGELVVLPEGSEVMNSRSEISSFIAESNVRARVYSIKHNGSTIRLGISKDSVLAVYCNRDDEVEVIS